MKVADWGAVLALPVAALVGFVVVAVAAWLTRPTGDLVTVRAWHRFRAARLAPRPPQAPPKGLPPVSWRTGPRPTPRP